VIMRVMKDEEEADKYWITRRESFALLRKAVGDKQTAPFIDDVVVRPDYLPEFLPEVLKILKEHKINVTLAGHAGSGNFHIIPLMDLSKSEEREKILSVSDKVYDLVVKYKGSITAEHNDGIIRTPYLEQMYGSEVYGLFKEVKNIFDPLNIFNPGKKVGGSKEYIRAHIVAKTDS
jgi:FAD/FMN-containing dehydrogenase